VDGAYTQATVSFGPLALLQNDRPFAAGGITLTPTAFREIALD
jgi:hypothetical protein